MQLVIFDCDGVLIDSEIIAAEVEAEAYRKLGFDVSVTEYCARFSGLSHDRIRELVEEELGHAVPDGFDDERYAAFRARMDMDLKMIEGAHDVLDAIDYPRCICSNSQADYLRTYLSKFDLFDRFRPYVFSARDVRDGKTKPEPDVFLHAADEFEADPGACCVIEDSAHGVTAAKAAGMRVIGFTGASHTFPGHADALTDAGAETVVNRLKDVPATIEALRVWREPAF